MANSPPGEPSPVPFPWMPMLAIAVGLVSHSYSLSSLFPYVGYMVQQLGVTDDKDEAGYYAGYLSSALMVGRFAFSYFWGRIADRYGRLPVLYIGLSSIAIFSVGFGLSTSFWWAVACRFLLGAMNGVVAIGKCMISEVCGKEHEAVGMSFITVSWSVGLVFGPALGGLLSETTDSGLFGRFPYLLPNILGASLALSGLPMVFFFLKETTHLDNGSGSGDTRGDFKPIPTSDTKDAEVDMEEGRTSSLEMTPLTQANSLDSEGSHGGNNDCGDAEDDLAALLEGTLDESALNRAATVGRGGGGDEDRAPSDGAVASVNKSIGTRTDASGGRRGAFGEGEMESIGGEARTTRGAAVLRELLVPVKLLREKRVRAILFVYCFYSFACIGWGEVYPLWALSTVANGGLDWKTDQIGKCIDMGVDSLYPLWAISSVASGGLDWSTSDVGQVLSLCGVGMLAFQLLLYPRMSKRMGVTTTQRLACFLAIPVYLFFPSLSRLHDSKVPLLVASVGFNFLNNVTATAIFINTALATNNAVDPSRRATINGLSMAVGSIAKAAGPAFFSAVFAWSIDGPRPRPFPLDYHLVFYLLALSMAVVSWVSWNVITGNPPPPTEPEAVAATATRPEG